MTTATIRTVRPSDAAAVAAIYAPLVRDTAVSFETTPPDADEMRRRIDTTLPWWPWLVAERDAVVGYAYAGRHRARAGYRWSADVSVYVAAAAHGAGIGRRLYTAVLDLLAAQGYVNAFAGIALPNPASERLHRTVGFTPIGVYRSVGWKLGAWHDVQWWQRTLSPGGSRDGSLDAAPDEPIPFARLSASVVARAVDPPSSSS